MSDYFDRVERQIVNRVEAGLPGKSRLRGTLGHLATAAAVLVVIVVAGVFLLPRGNGTRTSSPAVHPDLSLLFAASPIDPQTPLGPAIDQSVGILRKRFRAVLPGVHVVQRSDGVAVTLANPPAGARSRVLALAAPGRLAFYDWEANAITPNGKSVASLLPSQNPAALTMSQGDGAAAPGEPGAGSMSLHQALALAVKLGAGMARRDEYIGRLKLVVPIGYAVLQAAAPHPGAAAARFYLLRDRSFLFGNAIVNPKQSSAPNTGVPDITVGFTASGRGIFHALTATVARRGALVSGLGQTLNQHFAIELDNKLISVPFVDFKQYPDGITGDHGADLSAGFTTQSANNLAILLRYGPLPVNLTATG
jgi:hypothetical protein